MGSAKSSKLRDKNKLRNEIRHFHLDTTGKLIMQDAKSDGDKGQRVGVEEQFINFRTSPNLKKIKKFFQAKFNTDNDACGSNAPVTISTCVQESDKSEIQPPLPLDPPPPDSPTKDSNCVKQELKKEEKKPDKAFVMCKNFVRGTCTLGDTCRYVHKIDKNQLKDVYKFCHIFQNNNSVCNLAVCKYVHADIFEAAEFERSGYLPPHCTAHWNKQKPVRRGERPPSAPRPLSSFLMPPPPPPPPLPKQQTPVPKPAQTRPHTQPARPMPAKTAAPIADQLKLPAPVTVPALTPFAAAIETTETKKVCSNCVVMDNRLNHAKKQLDTMKMSLQALNDKINNVVWCDKFLRGVLTLQQEKLPLGSAISNGNGNPGDEWSSLFNKLQDSFNPS